MSNPWLAIPLCDYEQHMSLPEVQQLGALADLFAKAVAICSPASVAILGIAGGNGLERIDGKITKRIVGLDVNPDYLKAVRQRHRGISGLELYCVDLAEKLVQLEPVQLVHAALVFEHAGTGHCLENALELVAAHGTVSVVLQLPSQLEQSVAPTGIPSMQQLKSQFTFVDPDWLRQTLEARGFRLTHDVRYDLPAGKSFWMGLFGRQ